MSPMAVGSNLGKRPGLTRNVQMILLIHTFKTEDPSSLSWCEPSPENTLVVIQNVYTAQWRGDLFA